MTTVLIVDDDSNLAQLVSALVERGGYETVVVNNPILAIRHVYDVDVVLSDFHLGYGLNGLDLIHVLREAVPGIPAILATANASAELHESAELLGVEHIIKPFVATDLAEAIERALARTGEVTKGGT